MHSIARQKSAVLLGGTSMWIVDIAAGLNHVVMLTASARNRHIGGFHLA